MKSRTAILLLMTLLAAACGRQETNSDGNGTGKADGVGGRADPPTAPATDLGVPAPGSEASSTDSASTPSEPQPNN
jgi:hypothetical protein